MGGDRDDHTGGRFGTTLFFFTLAFFFCTPAFLTTTAADLQDARHGPIDGNLNFNFHGRLLPEDLVWRFVLGSVLLFGEVAFAWATPTFAPLRHFQSFIHFGKGGSFIHFGKGGIIFFPCFRRRYMMYPAPAKSAAKAMVDNETMAMFSGCSIHTSGGGGGGEGGGEGGAGGPPAKQSIVPEMLRQTLS